MSVISRVHSFGYAINGLYQLLKQEPNARLHAIATMVAIAAGIARHISPKQWIAIILVIGMVWITEAINTCIEKVCNLCCGGKWHPQVKVIKDIAAGSVFLSALVSIAVGILVFFF